MFRIGYGKDIHKFADNRKLIIGGVDIPFEKGLAGHSDADVLLHAVADALLGAAGLGDIGRHFPDTDQKYKDASSMNLLEITSGMIREAGYDVMNIDSVLILQHPKVAPYIKEMCGNIANVLKLDTDRISVKATTSEGLGFEGRGEGVTAEAVVLLMSRKAED